MVVTGDVNVSQKRERRILGNVALYRFAVKKKKEKKKKEKKKKEIRDSALCESRCHVRRQNVEQGRRGERTEKENRMQRYATRAVRCYMRV